VKIGLNMDSLGGLSLDDALDAAQRLGIAAVEFPTGAWSSAPHVDLDRLLESEAARDELLGRVRDRGLAISALTCNGNQLDPVGGPAHDEVTRKTIALAPLLDVDRVILMSGLPGGPGDRYANWIVVAWPPEAQAVLEHQWRVVTDYWQNLTRHAEEHGGVRLCIEMHGQQLVYNVPTLMRLREAAGPLVGRSARPRRCWQQRRRIGPASEWASRRGCRTPCSAPWRTSQCWRWRAGPRRAWGSRRRTSHRPPDELL
jgi:sugar phosphate isomerase/epimerase